MTPACKPQPLESQPRSRATPCQRDLADLTRAISHDLAEPLRMVNCFLQLLQERYGSGLDDSARQFMTYARDGGARLEAMIAGLSSYSRACTKTLEIQETDAADALREAVGAAKEQIEQNDARVLSGTLPVVWADHGQLVQVFTVLLDNALKFRRKQVPPCMEIGADCEIDAFRFRVTDNGIGINPAHVERVFGFFQRLLPRGETPGVGMGLTVARRILERHGGRIWIDAEPDRGTTVHFTLPRKQNHVGDP